MDVWRKISSVLGEKGHQFTPDQCDKKMRSLRYRYNIIVEGNSKTGNSRRKWEWFDVMDEVMAGDPAVQPLTTISSMEGVRVRQTKVAEPHAQSSTSIVIPPHTSSTISKTPSATNSSSNASTCTSANTPSSPSRISGSSKKTVCSKKRRVDNNVPPQWFKDFAAEQNKILNDIKDICKERNEILKTIADGLLSDK